MEDRRCFILGLPNAGKSTFLAALWYSLFHGKNNKLRYSKLDGNLTYLQKLSSTWANAKILNRTVPGEEKENISLLLEGGGQEFRLNLPDLSGETFRNHYTNRTMSKELAEYINEAEAVILFINTVDIKDILFHADFGSDLLGEGDNSLPSYEGRAVENDPMQVQLVDLLQFLEYIREGKLIKLGIMLSAWDEVVGSEYENKPELLVEKRMPLLWQFLKSNPQLFRCKYWGVSAQGGQLDVDGAEKLLEHSDPTDRIFLVNNDGQRSKDITAPIDCLLGE